MNLGQLLVKLTNKVSVDALHPVGEVYLTTDSSFNPNTSWGGMEQIVS